MAEQVVLHEVVDNVGVITLNRPDRHNALDNPTFERFAEAIDAVVDDDAVRCILLRGAGRSFCSGRDVAHIGAREGGESDHSFVRRHQQTRLRTLETPKPVIAAVQGHALGAGFEIALSADIRLVATDAVFSLPEVAFGLVPDTGGTQLLVPLIGPAKTKYLVLTAERIPAELAHAWGIADFVLPPDELQDAAMRMATRIAAMPPTAVAMAKQLVDQSWAGAIRQGFGQELLAQTALLPGEEHRRAKAALVAKRRRGGGAAARTSGAD